jgi:hypothetical protein
MTKHVQNISGETLWLPGYGWPGLGLTLQSGDSFDIADADSDSFGGGQPSLMWLVT